MGKSSITLRVLGYKSVWSWPWQEPRYKVVVLYRTTSFDVTVSSSTLFDKSKFRKAMNAIFGDRRIRLNWSLFGSMETRRGE